MITVVLDMWYGVCLSWHYVRYSTQSEPARTPSPQCLIIQLNWDQSIWEWAISREIGKGMRKYFMANGSVKLSNVSA